MRTKQFKAESKKLLDMMINSIYTHKEIFLRELISNASDAMDKLYYKSLSSDNTGLSREDFAISLEVNKDARTLTISYNGIGMTKEELENNLGTIAKSGSLQFKKETEKTDDAEVDIIGQSYYPKWHGELDGLKANLTDLATRYHKPIVVVEYQQYRKEVNEIVASLPENLGLGTFIWEATSPAWGDLFGRDGATNENMALYPEIVKLYEKK